MSDIIRNINAEDYISPAADSRYYLSPSQSLGWVTLSDGKQMRYDEFVRKLFKPQSEEFMKFHAGLGVTGEAGELGDVIKRELIYNSPVTSEKKPIRTGIIEELGDLRFYMQAVMNLYGVTEQEVLQHNACKLMERYEGLEYSDKKAQNRADKQGQVNLTEQQARAVDDTAGLEETNHPAKKPEGD